MRHRYYRISNKSFFNRQIKFKLQLRDIRIRAGNINDNNALLLVIYVKVYNKKKIANYYNWIKSHGKVDIEREPPVEGDAKQLGVLVGRNSAAADDQRHFANVNKTHRQFFATIIIKFKTKFSDKIVR